MNDIFVHITAKASHLAHYNCHSTTMSWENHIAMHLILPRELAKHNISEGTKAVTKYNSSK